MGLTMNAAQLPAPTQGEIDAALEREIETAYRAGLLAATNDREEARQIFVAMAELIKRRSPEQIARLEQERGLC